MLQPTFNRVMLRFPRPDEKTSGGIFIPESSQKKQVEGVVEAVGPECKYVKPGMTVVCSDIAGYRLADTDVPDDGSDWRLVNEPECLCIKEG